MECVDVVHMTLAEYGAVRAHPERFLVAPAEQHVLSHLEQIVARTDRFWLVEKLDRGAGQGSEPNPHG
jgi:hypothetical protein